MRAGKSEVAATPPNGPGLAGAMPGGGRHGLWPRHPRARKRRSAAAVRRGASLGALRDAPARALRGISLRAAFDHTDAAGLLESRVRTIISGCFRASLSGGPGSVESRPLAAAQSPISKREQPLAVYIGQMPVECPARRANRASARRRSVGVRPPRAKRTTSRRVCNPSFVLARARWPSTVLGLRYNSSPVSLAEKPLAYSSMTVSSRGESTSGPGLRLELPCARLRATRAAACCGGRNARVRGLPRLQRDRCRRRTCSESPPRRR